MTITNIDPVNVSIEDVSITPTNATESFSILPQTIEINLHEDMFSSHGCVFGNVVIADAVGLSELIPFSGQDKINIKIKSATGSLEKTYFVYAVTDKELFSGKKTAYNLHFISEPWIKSQLTSVSKAYRNMSIADMVTTIFFENKLITESNPGYFTTSTVGKYDIIVPNMKPIPAIKWLAKRALSDTAPNCANYIFYETITNGFFFVPIEKLTSASTKRSYIYSDRRSGTGGENLSVEQSMNNIISFTYGALVDTLDGINRGEYASSLYEHDIMDKIIRAYDFQYHNQYDKIPHLEPDGSVGGNRYLIRQYRPELNGLFNEFADENAVKNNKQYFISTHSHLFGAGTEIQDDTEAFQNRKSYMSQLNHIILNFCVPGNPNVSCGDVVNVTIPSSKINLSGEAEPIDKYYSGRSLVTAVKHVIRRNDYKTYIQVRKDSYKSPLPDKSEFSDKKDTPTS